VTELFLKLNHKKTAVRVLPGALNHIGPWIAAIHTPPVVLICSDETVADLYAERILASLRSVNLPTHLHTFPPGDASKTLSELARIHDHLGQLRLSRDGLLIALGGGVVSDLTGFAAATWMRGVRFAICPTTLEADVDACIGGKTGINHPAGKNLVGAFHHPELIAVDPECLRTLPARDVSAGLAESIKHALIADPAFLDWHETHRDDIRALTPAVLAELIERNLRIKISVVESDEREHSRRAILNFGHTIGHAIEQWCEYDLRHGEAVALGMVAAADLSCALDLLSATDTARIRDVLRSFDLPTTAPRKLDVGAVAALTHGDKKSQSGRRRWVLLYGIGHPVILDDVDDAAIHRAIAGLNPAPRRS